MKALASFAAVLLSACASNPGPGLWENLKSLPGQMTDGWASRRECVRREYRLVSVVVPVTTSGGGWHSSTTTTMELRNVCVESACANGYVEVGRRCVAEKPQQVNPAPASAG